MFNKRTILQHFYEMRHYIGVTFVLFFAGIVVGGSSNPISLFLDNQLRGIGNISQQLSSHDNPQLYFFIFIFLNNAIKSIFVMFLGGAFGFIPAVFIVFNGMIIGRLFFISSANGANIAELIFKGILPHGIIEIPMIILACAYGIRFGTLIVQTIVRSIRPSRQDALAKERALESYLRFSVPVMVIVVAGLFIAAIIESTFTFWLMRG